MSYARTAQHRDIARDTLKRLWQTPEYRAARTEEARERWSDPASNPGNGSKPSPLREQIGALRAEGVGRVEIARRLGVSLGVVDGHCFRMGLCAKREHAADKPFVRPQPERPLIVFMNTGATRDFGCRFIEGDDFRALIRRGESPYCGAKRVLGSMYCAEHEKRCSTPAGRAPRAP